jgi:uncharacterized protein (TIGR03032 family)
MRNGRLPPASAKEPSAADLDLMWQRHHAEWREAAQVTSHWQEAADVDPNLLHARTRGPWWELLDERAITLLVTREYEHLVMGFTVAGGSPLATFMRVPHPSGLVADRARGIVHLASTRNPNQIFAFAPVEGTHARRNGTAPRPPACPLVPLHARFYPGSLYLHDLALIGGVLHANAVGQNAIVRLAAGLSCEPIWWPRAIEVDGTPDFTRNYLQLNSIAAGPDLAGSYFTASSAAISARRPGHRNYPVDGRGVVFEGATREPIAGGLTRPHSARLRDGAIWLDNSGYGEVGVIADGRFEAVTRLQGWTRGLVFHDDVAFVGLSRVIPRFRQYAPGLAVERSSCGIVALEVESGAEIARITWPSGNQVFGIDWLPRATTHGFPFTARRRSSPAPERLFYSFRPLTAKEPARP